MTKAAAIPGIDLGGGVTIPQVGFGTWRIDPAVTQEAVEQALSIGYTHIDTAKAYLNEAGVGAALEATGAAGKVFVTTKLPNYLQGYDSTLAAFEKSRELLRVDVVDLYLIHWPCPSKDAYVDTWRAFQRLRDEGAVRAIGVCNFMPEHIERLQAETGELPVINQIECHPCFSQPDLDAYCVDHGIRIEAYSPLGRGKDLEAAPVKAAAEAHGATPAQIVLAWHVQHGHVVIPKSVHPDRMRQNLDAAGIKLTPAEMAALDALDSPEGTVGHDPRTFEDPQDPEATAKRLGYQI